MLEFLPANHAVQRIGPAALEALKRAQTNVMPRAFGDAREFCLKILSDLKIDVEPSQDLVARPATEVSDLHLSDLKEFWSEMVQKAGIPESGAILTADNLAQRSQLVRAFDDPDAVLEWAKAKVLAIVLDFPKTERDLEVGRNPGDVLDPYILAATQYLLYQGDFKQAIGATVAHKALMILEGLLGHLHEEVVGRMRGNMKTTEPRGENQELYDPNLNPFPGADIVQPPAFSGQPLRLHQVKSKTGTLNSSGGARLAEQMRQLRMRFKGAEIYSHSLVGNTLRGHRTMGTMLRAEPDLIVTVGQNAFAILTGSSNGAELLLSLYQNAFQLAAKETGYNIETMAASITEAFRVRAEAEGESFMESMLHLVTRGTVEQQDSRHYISGRIVRAANTPSTAAKRRASKPRASS